MQINLAGALAEDFRQSSTGPQPPQTELIRSIAHGDRRAMHVLFAQYRLAGTGSACMRATRSPTPQSDDGQR
jgi:hypothetical protein